ncbi:uncharacterized protein CBL_08963 [Carabus blaptoides fortunei]
MLNGKYRSDFVQQLDENTDINVQDVKIGEWQLAVYGLCVSLSVLCAKTVYAYRDVLYDFLYEDKLLSYETITENGELMYRYVRSTVLRSHHILFPVLCGLLMTSFTWLMMYLDSSVPGVQPPTPFSPARYKVRSGHSFHLGYVIAVVNGVMVFTLMLVNGIYL